MNLSDSKSSLPPDLANEDASDALPPYEESPSSGPSSEPAPPAYQPSMIEVGLTANKGKEPTDAALFDVHAYNAEIVAPAALLVDGQTIYAETASDAPLYRVNRGLATLGPATKTVELDRLEQRSPSAIPVVLRPRNMYTLHHSRPFDYILGLGGAVSGSRPEYYLHAANSRAAPLGHVGLRGRHFAQWSAVPILLEFNTKDAIKGVGWDQAHTTPIFRVQQHPTREGVLMWLDGAGQEVALMYETTEGPTGEGASSSKPVPTPRLLITAPMRRDRRDTLVALWCCYAWAQGVSRHVEVPLPRGKNPYKMSRVFN